MLRQNFLIIYMKFYRLAYLVDKHLFLKISQINYSEVWFASKRKTSFSSHKKFYPHENPHQNFSAPVGG